MFGLTKKSRKRIADRRAKRRDFKLEKREQKFAVKHNRIDSRENVRMNRINTRGEVKMTAYANGIDPNAWIGETTGQLAKGVSSFVNPMSSRPQGGAMNTSNMVGFQPQTVSQGNIFTDLINSILQIFGL